VTSVRPRVCALAASIAFSLFHQQPALPDTTDANATTNASLQVAAPTPQNWADRLVGTPIRMHAKFNGGTSRSYMWYAARQVPSGTSSSSSSSDDVNLELAISDDGTNYTPITSDDSPCKTAGVVISARQLVPNSQSYTSVRLGAPVLTQRTDGLHLTVYHVELKGAHPVSAGVSLAQSVDGVHWNLEKSNPLTIKILGESTSASAGIETRLKAMSDACAQM